MILDFKKNYFELFELPVQYDLDINHLAERYRVLQKIVHPDRYANASEQERRLSVQGAALINEAYNTLKDPLARSTYLLMLNGVDLSQQNNDVEPDFLMQQMEMREELQNISQQTASSAVLDKTYSMQCEIEEYISSLLQNIQTELNGNAWQAAANSVKKIQFFKKLKIEIEELIDRLEDEIN